MDADSLTGAGAVNWEGTGTYPGGGGGPIGYTIHGCGGGGGAGKGMPYCCANAYQPKMLVFRMMLKANNKHK